MSDAVNGPDDPVSTDPALDRRGLLRRGAIIGAGLVWAVPTVQSFARPAFAGTPVEDATDVGTPADVCKNGGWRNLSTATGRSFSNQGDCVSYVARGGQPS